LIEKGSAKSYQYNGKELNDDFGLNWNHHDWRFYDVAINRFVTIDPESEKDGQMSFTPYHFGLNNPVRYDDPNGRNPILGAIIGATVDYAFQVAKNMGNGKSFTESLTHNINGKSILISAVAGAATSGLSALEMSAGQKLLLSTTVDVTESMAKQATDPDNTKGVTLGQTFSDVASGYVAGELTKKAGDVVNTTTLKSNVEASASSGNKASLEKANSSLKIAERVNHASGKTASGVVGNTIQATSNTLREDSEKKPMTIVKNIVAPQDNSRSNFKPLIIKN
jgi:RHS repeat-associated protein